MRYIADYLKAVRNWASNHKPRRPLSDGYEIERVAREVGVSPNELQRMTKRGPDAAKLLLVRMAAFHLDAALISKINPATMRDLQRLCSNCASKRRCQRDLLRSRQASRRLPFTIDDPRWRHYCPNAGTLDALQSPHDVRY